MKRVKLNHLDTLSHELKTPLSILYGSIEMLDMYYKLGKFDDLDMPAIIDSMKNNHRLLNKLTHNILDITALKGKTEIHCEFIDLELLLDGMRSMICAETLEKEVDINISIPVKRIHVYANMDYLERLIMNLVSNSIKYSGDKCKIGITAQYIDDTVQINFSDNGIGIPADKLSDIFEPYIKLNSESKGAGLGLPIVKTITELHKGTISCTSDDSGTTFTITLPNVQTGSTLLKSNDYLLINKDVIYTELADVVLVKTMAQY